MADNIAIKVDSISKTFKLPHEKNSSVKGALINFYKRNKSYEIQEALEDISFDIKEGEFFGIIGRNGSGKSTLLKLMAGIYEPDKGKISTKGSLTPFIELGVGFNPELTGRENVFLNGALLGFSRKEMEDMYDDIVDFAEIERFMDQKLKNYSSGMQVRLAFSIAIRSRSDILLLDEVLAVGDADFQRKCFQYFTYLKKNKKTVILVSHDMESIRKYCDRIVFIDQGKLIMSGLAQEVIPEFMARFIEKSDNEDENDKKNEFDSNELPLGLSSATSVDESVLKIGRLWIEDTKGNRISKLDDSHKEYLVNFKIKVKKDVSNVIPGVIISNEYGDFVVAINSKWAGIVLSNKFYANKEYCFRFKLNNIYEKGTYNVSANVVSDSLDKFYAWKNYAASFYADRGYITGAKTNPGAEIEVVEL